ncbi:MAG: hypothetical protein M1480_02620 [Bacteroidetes bacterium]|nr:hypothetical protein [Bacteroidota bacterium]
MDYSIKKKLFLIVIFSIAMGIFEAIVVVYLRNIYYPDGFQFPLTVIPDHIIKVELLREVCTMIMLLSVAWIAGRNKLQIFSYFLFNFAIWDIIYYAGLKLILNWPPSLFTWDILFLIPIPWLGPVAAPIISSITMATMAILFLYLQKRNNDFYLKKIEWILIYIGALLIFISFIWDYADIIISNNLLDNIFSLTKNPLFNNIMSNFVPESYHWNLFILGLLTISISIFLIFKRNSFKKK